MLSKKRQTSKKSSTEGSFLLHAMCPSGRTKTLKPRNVARALPDSSRYSSTPSKSAQDSEPSGSNAKTETRCFISENDSTACTAWPRSVQSKIYDPTLCLGKSTVDTLWLGSNAGRNHACGITEPANM